MKLGSKEHKQREDLDNSVEKGQENLSHMSLNGDIKEEEQKTHRREDSQTPKRETAPKANEAMQEREIWENAPKGPIPDGWDTTGVTDSQLLAMLASKHCYQCTSNSTLDWTDYE